MLVSNHPPSNRVVNGGRPRRFPLPPSHGPFSTGSAGDGTAFKWFASVVHELRRSLDGAVVVGDTLVADHGDHLNEAGAHLLKRMRAQLCLMTGLVDELQGYLQRPSEGLALQTVSLATVLNAVEETLREGIERSGGWISTSLGDCAVRADPEGLVRVIHHLFDNAVRFAKPEAGPLIRVSARRFGARVRIEVEDSGVGIPPERLDELFQEVGPRPGAGSGLAAVRGAVEAMGGRIGVESRAGEGSLFWIELAADQPPVE